MTCKMKSISTVNDYEYKHDYKKIDDVLLEYVFIIYLLKFL